MAASSTAAHRTSEEIEALGDQLYLGIEVGAPLRSDDAGQTFSDPPVDPYAGDVDIHKIVEHAQRPGRIVAAKGWDIISSEGGGASWEKGFPLPRRTILFPWLRHPHGPELLFVADGEGWPTRRYATRSFTSPDGAQPRRRIDVKASAGRFARRQGDTSTADPR